MTQILKRSSRIARRMVQQGARPAMVSQVAVEKSDTETKTPKTSKLCNIKPILMKGKRDIFMATLNVQTLQKEWKIPEVISSELQQRSTFLVDGG